MRSLALNRGFVLYNITRLPKWLTYFIIKFAVFNLSFPYSNGGIDEEITFSEPAEATEQPARQDLYTEVVKLEQSSSISQMLAQPDFQYPQTWYKKFVKILGVLPVRVLL